MTIFCTIQTQNEAPRFLISARPPEQHLLNVNLIGSISKQDLIMTTIKIQRPLSFFSVFSFYIFTLNIPHNLIFNYDNTNQSVSHDISDGKHSEHRGYHNLSGLGNHDAFYFPFNRFTACFYMTRRKSNILNYFNC